MKKKEPMSPKIRNIYFICLTGIFFLACLFFTLNLNLDEKITSMLPDSDPEIADFKYILSHVPAGETLYINIETKAHDPDTLKKAADAFYDAIGKAPFFSDIVYRFSNESMTNLLDFVDKNKYWLFDGADLAEIDSGLTQENIQRRLLKIKQQVLDPASIFSVSRLTKDPFGFDELILSKLAAFKEEASGIKINGARIISRDEKHLLITAVPTFPAVDTRQSAKMMAFLNQEKAKVTKTFKDNIHIGFSGNHIATLDNSTTIQADVKKTALALTAGIFVIGFFFFGRFLYVILIFVPTLVSLTFASALISFTTHDVSAIALGCGAVLMGISVDFGIHILFSVDAAGTGQTDSIISRLKRPIAIGAATTVAAFACLLFSSLPGQRQIGFFTIAGDLGAAFFSVFILKYFIVAFPSGPKKPLISLINGCDILMAFRKKHIRLVSLISLLLFGISLTGLGNFRFDGDVSALNHLTDETQKDMDDFLSTWGRTSLSVVLVKAGTLEQALQKNDDLFKLLKGMEDREQVDHVASLSDIFPSNSQRKTRYENFQKLMPGERIDSLEKTMAEVCLANGFSKDAFSPFFKGLKEEKKPFSIKDFTPTILNQLIKSKLLFQQGNVLILTTFNIKDRYRIPDIITKIKTAVPQSHFMDKRHLIKKITTLVASEFKRFFLFAAASMVMVLLIFQGGIRIVLITIIPALLSAVMTAGLLGLANIPINLISILFIIFIFGVGVDFSVFLVHHEINKEPHDRHVAVGAVIIGAMTTIGGFACLAFAQHTALYSIGVAGLTGMLTSLMLSLVLIPTLAEKWIINSMAQIIDN
jgi:uncharacterized protein